MATESPSSPGAGPANPPPRRPVSDYALLSVAQMTEADRRTIAGGTPGSLLMENAGLAVAREIGRRWSPRPVTVLCGPGNNGGDGFVAANALARLGWPVRVALAGEREKLKGDAALHAARWQGAVEAVAPGAIEGAALLVDALFGSGLSRRLDPVLADTLTLAWQRGIPIVAVDVPSGIQGDTGDGFDAAEAPGALSTVAAVAAETLGTTSSATTTAAKTAGTPSPVTGAAAACTITFARKKPGHVLFPGRGLCGDVVVADIGIPEAVLESVSVDTWENHPSLWHAQLPQAQPAGNKYSRGHALLYGGYPMTGAARMAARAAASMGAGLTTIAVPEEAFDVYAASLTSIMVRPLKLPDDFDHLLSDKRFTAFLIGPGAGVKDLTREKALAMLATSRPVLLDADAISVFSSDPGELARAIRGPCVLTPHEGEFARLFDAKGDKLSRARAAARRSGAVIVLKGADTVVTSPDGRAIINTNAPASLATAGSDDVLGGFILGLLAQGMDAFLAAAAAVWMHGAAAAEFGGPGLLAEDLPELLPAVLRGLDPARG